MLHRIGLPVLLLLSSALEAKNPDHDVTRIPPVTEPVLFTADSRLLMSAVDSQTPLVFPADGHVEEGMFDSGTAKEKYLAQMKVGSVNPPTAGKLIQQDTIETSAGNLVITTISHASLMFSVGGKTVYVDPVSTATDYSKLPKADLVLVTHEHPDHLDRQAIETLNTDRTILVASRSCLKALPNAHILSNGEEGVFVGFKVEAVPAYNLVHKRPDGAPDHAKGDGNGYVVTFGNKRVYIAGDTENIPEMKELKRIDIAFLPMNLPYTMSPEMVADAAKAIQPKILYPYHFSNTDPHALVQLLKEEKGIEVRIRDLR